MFTRFWTATGHSDRIIRRPAQQLPPPVLLTHPPVSSGEHWIRTYEVTCDLIQSGDLSQSVSIQSVDAPRDRVRPPEHAREALTRLRSQFSSTVSAPKWTVACVTADIETFQAWLDERENGSAGITFWRFDLSGPEGTPSKSIESQVLDHPSRWTRRFRSRWAQRLNDRFDALLFMPGKEFLWAAAVIAALSFLTIMGLMLVFDMPIEIWPLPDSLEALAKQCLRFSDRITGDWLAHLSAFAVALIVWGQVGLWLVNRNMPSELRVSNKLTELLSALLNVFVAVDKIRAILRKAVPKSSTWYLSLHSLAHSFSHPEASTRRWRRRQIYGFRLLSDFAGAIRLQG